MLRSGTEITSGLLKLFSPASSFLCFIMSFSFSSFCFSIRASICWVVCPSCSVVPCPETKTYPFHCQQQLFFRCSDSVSLLIWTFVFHWLCPFFSCTGIGEWRCRYIFAVSPTVSVFLSLWNPAVKGWEGLGSLHSDCACFSDVSCCSWYNVHSIYTVLMCWCLPRVSCDFWKPPFSVTFYLKWNPCCLIKHVKQ